ncbi:MAG: sigma-54-dependent Fis family transcriptional regulator [Opitutaceae bacterium]|nr:sigma-54-dependent Fis family transcriptional regulator [Opitutaceae bacterium]
MNPEKITIVVLDRNAADLAALTESLKAGGYRVLPASSVAQVENYARKEPVNLVVKGFEAGRVDAIALMRKVRAISRDTEFVLCGQGGTIAIAVDAVHQGAFDYLVKPVEPAALRSVVLKALERQALVAEDPKLRQSLRRRADPDVFVGTSAAMRQVADTLAEVATTDVPILVTGESGTGKELVARALHERSNRHAGPFIAINCAGLPDSLIESELFGHVRGAFTNAINDRPGAFKLAQNGTLFLDEIGDLAPKGQGDLLRVLEDGVYRPVGSPETVRANVRIVAASNRDLARLANEGRFRSDLLYRLNIVELFLPPLRARVEDIPALIESFNRHFCARHNRRPKTFTPEFIAQVTRHPWPGNIRQLRNLIERLIVTVRASAIGIEHAPPLPDPAVVPADDPLLVVPRGTTLAEVEARMIRQTLEKVTSQRSEAARLLGLSRRALHYKLKALKLE